MINIADYFVAVVRDGQADDHRYNSKLSSVSYDQRTHYYDLKETGVTLEQFSSFVESNWQSDNDDIVFDVSGSNCVFHARG